MRIRISQAFAVLLILLIVFSGNYWEKNAPQVNAILFLLGMVLAAIGSMGRLWCTLYIAGYKEENLITVGPYSLTRNPLYFFSLVGGIGVGFASETLLIPFLILVVFAFYYPHVIREEEGKLRELHGEEFENYVRTVPAFFPSMKSFVEAENYTVKPILFRKNMFDALWFIWLIGILEVIEELHELGILPVLFTIF